MKIIKSPRSLIFALTLFFFNFFCSHSYSAQVESKYFDLSVYEGCDLTQFAKKIDIGLSVGAAGSYKNVKDTPALITQNIDALYLEICDVLGIHMYTYRSKIKVVPSRKELMALAFKGTTQLTEVPPAIYVHADNTVYVSFADFTVGILAHEIGHAIISNYFIMPPPPRVQEILCGYVEYAVRSRLQ